MSIRDQGLFVGAYALYTTMQGFTRFTEADVLRYLQSLTEVKGLELPFWQDFHQEDSEGFLAALPPTWQYLVTPLPGLMQALAVDPQFGLASESLHGRTAALAHLEKVRQRVADMTARNGRRMVRAVLLHSGPTQGRAGVGSSRAAYLRSLEQLCAWDWSGAELLLEHCDAFDVTHAPNKGFLSLTDELQLAAQLGLGMNINWGRLAVECRSLDLLRERITEVWSKGLLRAFVFSGATLGTPHFGDWQDQHAPIACGSGKIWDPPGGLLNRDEVSWIFALMASRPPAYWGLKVQPLPAELSIAARLDCIGDQVQVLRQLSARVSGGSVGLQIVN